MKKGLFVIAAIIAIAGCKKDKEKPQPEAIVVSASGDITTKMDEFRTLLGAVLNTTPGQTSGRREINWDGVPDSFSLKRIPSDFFNPLDPGAPAARQRGLVYSGSTDARVSSNAFADLEPTNANEFVPFSGSKVFSAVSSNAWNVDFQVAGQSVAASIKGFGAVFSDVDRSTTTIEYFSGPVSLGVFTVPVKTTGSHSFLGVYFPHEKVTRVKITQGEAPVAAGQKDVSSGGTNDLVVMDDFLYDEPRANQ